jgi:hypothetical protein
MTERELNKELQELLDQHDCPSCLVKDSCLYLPLALYTRENMSELNGFYESNREKIWHFAKASAYCVLGGRGGQVSARDFLMEMVNTVGIAFMAGYVVGKQTEGKGGE